ncbi:hypothetical protein ACQKE0_01535 [Shewanella colwelliana]|uniref:hypothetical protein n=1 Tax=Shewanella colwelliana TaxID=23 RepID=UPI003CFEBDB5
MNSRYFKIPTARIEGFNVALLELDMDESAERFVVIDENKGLILGFGTRPLGGIAKVTLPVKYAIDAICTVCIIDIDKTFKIKAVSGVKMELVNAYDVDMRQ